MWEAKINSLPSDDPYLEDRQVAFDDPEVPHEIQSAVQSMADPSHTLWRMATKTGLEWWLLDQNGELVEAFWME